MSRPDPDRSLVQLPTTTLSSLRRALAAEGDPEQAAELLRNVGMDAAGELFDLFQRRAGGGGGDVDALSSGEFWRRLDDFFRELGWGGLRHERLHDGVFALTSGDWFEANEATGGHPCCQFTVGVLAELFRRVAERDVAVLEVGCRGAGSGECRFLVGSPDALEAVYAEIADGGEYEQAVARLG